MPDYKAKVQFQGHGDKDQASMTIDLGTVVDNATALGNLNQIVTPLQALTDANITVTMSEVTLEEAGKPGFGIDAHDEAVIVTYLDAVGEKKHSVRIPAPVAGLINPDGMTVSVTNADLISFVSALSQYAQVSDGESIDTTLDNGINSGKFRSRAKTYNV